MTNIEKNKCVILLRPPDSAPVDFYSQVEHLGIEYIASFLEMHNIRVRIIDSILMEYNVNCIYFELKKLDFDILGISLYDISIEKTGQLLKKLKKIKPDIHINVGGHHPTFASDKVFKLLPEVDSITLQEGEITFYELVKNLRSFNNLDDVKGLIVRKKNESVFTGNRGRIQDLDSLPFPRRIVPDLFPEKKTAFSVCSSRGCYRRCGYCTVSPFYSQNGNASWLGRSPENLIDEIKMLIERYPDNVDSINFIDAEIFGPGKKGVERVIRIAKELKNLNIKYSFNCRPDNVERELFGFLRDTGLQLVYIGIESGVQQVLDRWNRQCTVEQNIEAIKILKDLDIIIQPGFILYDPWTSLEELRENLLFIKNLGVFQLPLLVRPLEIRAGMDLEEIIQKKTMDNTFNEDYRFHDKRIVLFREIISVIFKRVFDLYNQLVEMRVMGELSYSRSKMVEDQLTDKIIDVSLDIIDEINDNGFDDKSINNLKYVSNYKAQHILNDSLDKISSFIAMKER